MHVLLHQGAVAEVGSLPMSSTSSLILCLFRVGLGVAFSIAQVTPRLRRQLKAGGAVLKFTAH